MFETSSFAVLPVNPCNLCGWTKRDCSIPVQPDESEFRVFERALMSRTQFGVCACGFSPYGRHEIFSERNSTEVKATHMHINKRLTCTLQKMRNAAVPVVRQHRFSLSLSIHFLKPEVKVLTICSLHYCFQFHLLPNFIFTQSHELASFPLASAGEGGNGCGSPGLRGLGVPCAGARERHRRWRCRQRHCRGGGGRERGGGGEGHLMSAACGQRYAGKRDHLFNLICSSARLFGVCVCHVLRVKSGASDYHSGFHTDLYSLVLLIKHIWNKIRNSQEQQRLFVARTKRLKQLVLLAAT